MRGKQRTHGRDRAISKLADRHHGIVSRQQLTGLGIEPGVVDRAIAAGRLHPLHRGVYAVGHRVLTPHARWMAAVLASGPGAVLSHWSAAALWGIRSNHGGAIHITSPSRTGSRRPFRRHHALLRPDEVIVHDDIPVTTVPRTIFDLAAGTPEAVEPALRQAEYLRRTDPLSLPHLLERHPGHRGNRAIQAALARLRETPGHTRGTFEDRFLLFVDRHRLPRPHFNPWITIGPDRFQVDCLWPDRRQIVELDGWSAHGTRTAFRDDKARDRKLAAHGYTVTRIPWSALDDEADQVAADLHRILGAARTGPAA